MSIKYKSTAINELEWPIYYEDNTGNIHRYWASLLHCRSTWPHFLSNHGCREQVCTHVDLFCISASRMAWPQSIWAFFDICSLGCLDTHGNVGEFVSHVTKLDQWEWELTDKCSILSSFSWMIWRHSTFNKSFQKVPPTCTWVANSIFYFYISSSSLCIYSYPSWFVLSFTLAPAIGILNKSLMHQTFSQTLLLEFHRLRNYIRKKAFKTFFLVICIWWFLLP